MQDMHWFYVNNMLVCSIHPLPSQKIALGINPISLFQVGFYSWISDTMCWYKEHFHSDHMLLSLC